MGLLNNRKYRFYICFAILFSLFVSCLIYFKPLIKMMELYTLFLRISPDTLKPVLDFGSDSFILPSVVPMIPNIEFAEYPSILNIFFTSIIVTLTGLLIFIIPNIFISFCLGLSLILGYCLFTIYMSHVYSLWIPIIWPILIQLFMFSSMLMSKIQLKQTKQISTIKLFGYDINKFPNSIPFIKNIIQQPKKMPISLACFKIKIPQIYLEEVSTADLVFKVNQIFQIIIDTTLKYNGIIDKTSNNTIIVYWLGKNHAMKAVKAAMEINSYFKENLYQEKTNTIKISCGISTDTSIFAILGSKNYSNYMVLGNIVDIANRLENACIFHNTSVLISNSTVNELKGKLIANHKGVISVHGIQSQIDFYEPENFIQDKMSYFDKLKEEFFND